jgi:hypothetical protein
MRRFTILVGLVTLTVPVWQVGASPAAIARTQAPTVLTPDFNGDGFADLAVGVPGEDVGGISSAGAVNVLYGRAAGISSASNQLWTQDSSGIQGEAEAFDAFGSAVAAGDFDGDGFTDLAVGVPGEGISQLGSSGAVAILYGSAGGLGSARNQFWTQDNPGILDVAENGDALGSAVAAGDFDGDGFADLAIGVPSEDVGGAANAGGVNLLFGSSSGLSSAGNEFWTQNSGGIGDASEANDDFGSSLSAADLDGDGFADLAVGVPGEEVAGIPAAGAVSVLYGTGSGLSSSGNQFWNQNSQGIGDTAEAADNFGASLTTGDADGDGFADLAVGVPDENVGSISNAGGVNVLYGTAGGLSSAGNQFWSQDSPSIQGEAETGDVFGQAVALGDFDGDGFADLGVGAPGEGIAQFAGAGSMQVIFGGAGGLTTAANQFWTQDNSGILDNCEVGDAFASSLAAVDFDGDGFTDLAVGVPDENVGSIANAGAANVLYGAGAGLSSAGNQFWNQNSSGILDTAEANDDFGSAMTG